MYIIDRFEENTAVVEKDGTFINVPRDKLPENAEEGDCLIFDDGLFKIDAEQTAKRKNEIKTKFDRLFKRRKND